MTTEDEGDACAGRFHMLTGAVLVRGHDPLASPGPDSPGSLRVSVDDEGIHARVEEPLVLDVHFDARRIWSFWLPRDGTAEVGGYFVRWPKVLLPFLSGRTSVTLSEHVTKEVVFESDVQFGTGRGRISVVDERGLPLAVDKSQMLMQTFDTRTGDQIAPLLDALERVLAALKTFGIEGFPVYGTLLGAVREGRVIGHDSDADLGYVSAHDHPFDVVIESFRLQRWLVDQGFSVTRYSGGAFKVEVAEADGSLRGLDVFGGLFRDGYLYLMGEIRVPFEREWLFPLGTCTLEGRELPAPARPEKLLSATYGDGWRTPDPAYQFETPATTKRRLNGWFRGLRVKRLDWELLYEHQPDAMHDVTPSAFAKWVVDFGGMPEHVVDIGCGRGSDILWFARQGVRAVGLDYVPRASESAARRAAAEGWDVEFRPFSLTELRSVLAVSSQLARLPGPRTVTARHVVDATSRVGRENLLRSSEMLLRNGGRLFLEFVVKRRPGEDVFTRDNLLRPLPMDALVREVEHRGGRVTHKEINEVDRSSQGAGRRIGRMVVEWKR